MNVAIFTDNDFDKINGVTTTFRAALESAPPGVHLRVYTAASRPADTGNYLALLDRGADPVLPADEHVCPDVLGVPETR